MNTRFFAALIGLSTCGATFATTVEMMAVQRGAATVRIDGRAPKTIHVGDLTPEGIYFRSISPQGEAKFRIRGVDETLAVGRTVAVSVNDTGLPSLVITADADGKFLGQFLALNQPFQVEVSPQQGVSLLMPAADAERLRLPYKDEPAKAEDAGKRRQLSQYPRPQKMNRKGKTYLNHFTEIKSVKVGGIELFGVKAIVSEDPELKRAVVGKHFLTAMDTTIEGSTLTMRRLP
jgi:hypothetical protein